jgi:hypothetical protein
MKRVAEQRMAIDGWGGHVLQTHEEKLERLFFVGRVFRCGRTG